MNYLAASYGVSKTEMNEASFEEYGPKRFNSDFLPGPVVRKSKTGDPFEELFDVLIAEDTDANRVKNWQQVMVARGFLTEEDPGYAYDANRWLKEAFLNFGEKKFSQRRVDGAIPTPDFSISNWYRYYLAVKWYKERFFYHCARAGLEIPR